MNDNEQGYKSHLSSGLCLGSPLLQGIPCRQANVEQAVGGRPPRYASSWHGMLAI